MMAPKAKPRAKRPAPAKAEAGAAKTTVKAAGKSTPKGQPSANDLAAENAALLQRLTAAEQRIAVLERQRDDALNRIEWVIDALNSLTEGAR